MNSIDDLKFQEICSLLYEVFFENKKIKKINIFLDNDKLINIKYENLAHLLGVQYYTVILNWNNGKKKRDFFNSFIYDGKNKKIIFSSIIKKINTNWNLIKNDHNFKGISNSKHLIYCLESKLKCFDYFIKNFIKFNETQNVLIPNKKCNKEIILLDNQHNNIDKFFIINDSNDSSN